MVLTSEKFPDFLCKNFRKYCLCFKLQNSTLVQTSYKYPLSSFFGLGTKKCSTTYVCPTLSVIHTTPEEGTTKHWLGTEYY